MIVSILTEHGDHSAVHGNGQRRSLVNIPHFRHGHIIVRQTAHESVPEGVWIHSNRTCGGTYRGRQCRSFSAVDLHEILASGAWGVSEPGEILSQFTLTLPQTIECTPI